MSLYTKRRRRKPEINIVPLMDVLTVLIFFFLLTMQFRDQQSLDITPPKMETAGVAKDAKRVVVSIDKTGKYFIDNAPMTQDQVVENLTKAAAEKGPETSVLIFADQDTPLKDVTFVMDQSRKLKMDKVRLQVR